MPNGTSPIGIAMRAHIFALDVQCARRNHVGDIFPGSASRQKSATRK